MENLKLFFSFFVLFFIGFSNSGNAQIQALDVNVNVTADKQVGTVTADNNTNRNLRLNAEVFKASAESATSKTLLNSPEIQSAVATLFTFENRLSTILSQEDLFKALVPIIEDDEFSPIIQQDVLLLPIIQQDVLLSSNRGPVIKFLRLLLRNAVLINAMQTILDKDGGRELILELFTSDKESLTTEVVQLGGQETGNFTFTLPNKGYDFIQIILRNNNGSQRKSTLYFP